MCQIAESSVSIQLLSCQHGVREDAQNKNGKVKNTGDSGVVIDVKTKESGRQPQVAALSSSDIVLGPENHSTKSDNILNLLNNKSSHLSYNLEKACKVGKGKEELDTLKEWEIAPFFKFGEEPNPTPLKESLYKNPTTPTLHSLTSPTVHIRKAGSLPNPRAREEAATLSKLTQSNIQHSPK